MGNDKEVIQDSKVGGKSTKYVNKNMNMAIRPSTVSRFRELKVHKRETDNDLLERLLDLHYPIKEVIPASQGYVKDYDKSYEKIIPGN